MAGSQRIFPAELVTEILCYTSPLDVVRWRAVSKWFSTITHDPAIWKALYLNACFLRPPGPFPTVPFEDALAKSTRLAQSWTTQGLRTMSRVRVPFDGWVTKHRHLVGGRWLVVCQADQWFVLYDTHIDAETRAQEPLVIWEQEEKIIAWDKCLATSNQGQCIIYVLMSTDNPPWLTLLEFRLDAESGAVCDTVTWDIPVSEMDDDPELDNGQELFAHSRFLFIPHQSLIFDTQTRTFYELPEFSDKIRSHMFGARQPGYTQIVPTNTHVIVFHDFCRQWPSRDIDTLVQAFVVPDDPRPAEIGKNVLRLTHEGTIANREMLFAIIQNSVADSTTGTSSIKFLERHRKYGSFVSICTHLTLEKPSPDNVLPALIKRHHILLHGNVPFNGDLTFCNAYYDITDDGYARGFFCRCTENRSHGVVKFTIDATYDYCSADLGRFSRAGEWDDIVSPIDHFSGYANQRLLLDGVRGKLIYVDTDSQDEHANFVENAAIVVVEIE
ncbi:hypothetical protein EV363DRAFT_1174348 [Boletus edulis]|nr:hypothetical protein EV363DRAFT_1174348 [Boletus edulis]